MTEPNGHRAVSAAWLLRIAEFDRQRGWADEGFGSCAEWLSLRGGIPFETAGDHVDIARRLADMPLVRAAFLDRRLTYESARAICRVATVDTEGRFLALAFQLTGPQLERTLRAHRDATSPGGQVRSLAPQYPRLGWDRPIRWPTFPRVPPIRTVLAALCLLGALLVLTPIPAGVRVVTVLPLALVVPGLALTRTIPVRDRLLEAILVFPLSGALFVLTAEASRLVGLWSPAALLVLLLTGSGALLLRSEARQW